MTIVIYPFAFQPENNPPPVPPKAANKTGKHLSVRQKRIPAPALALGLTPRQLMTLVYKRIGHLLALEKAVAQTWREQNTALRGELHRRIWIVRNQIARLNAQRRMPSAVYEYRHPLSVVMNPELINEARVQMFDALGVRGVA